MKAVLWFRTAAVLTVLFAAGHTYGFLTFRPATAEGQAVWAEMNGVHFTDGHGNYSYGNFYIGFGLSITAAMLFTAWLAWTLGSQAKSGAQGVRTIAWGMFVWQLAGIVLSVRYFALVPALLSVLVSVCLGLGAMLAPKPALR
jgi:hypothetical protein